MLMNDFYTINNLTPGENSVSGVITFNAAHDIFKGHFPGQPVVPGVCTMQIVKEILQEQTSKNLLLRSTGQVKFLQLLLPDVVPAFNISWKDTGEGFLVNATFRSETTDVFKMTGTFEIVNR